MVNVYFIKWKTQIEPGVFASCLSFLPDNEINKIRRFHRWQDAQACLLGKLMLIKGLNDYGYPREIIKDLKKTSFGKPFLDVDLNFNISHSGNYVVCSISKDNLVGIDIEMIKALSLEDFQQSFGENEWNIISNSANKINSFYKYWCIREALIKADGRGLSIPVDEISISEHIAMINKEKFYYQEIMLDEEYCCYLAVNNSYTEIKMKEFIMQLDIIQEQPQSKAFFSI